jgi:predicted dinucleotide-binding enzyme
VLVAVPGRAVAEALENVQGHAEFIKSKTNGPTAKSFNLNFASQYGKLGEAKSRPSNVWSGDEEARGVVEQLNRDAGYEPVHMGGLDKAATQEHGIEIIFAIAQTTGPFVYRIAPPEQL